MSRAKRPVYGIAVSARGEWSLCDDDGPRIVARSASAALDEIPEGAACVFRGQRAPRALVEAAIRQSIARGQALPEIGIRAGRGEGSAYGLAFVGLQGRRMLIDGSLSVADDDLETVPEGAYTMLADWQLDTRDAVREAAGANLETLRLWQAEVADLGLRPKLTAGSTALQMVPNAWIRAGLALRQSRPDDVAAIDGARYGGRVECFAPGWEGEAVEYDLRSAYGAAMLGTFGALPGAHLCDDTGKEPLPEQPGWWDVTVRVDHAVAPLPMRDPETPWRLSWPTGGEWRGTYTTTELEQPGVTVQTVHAVHRGRYAHELEEPVSALLEQRESAGPWRRAIVRQLVVSLAGKFAERPASWRLWVPAAEARLPKGAVQIGGLDSSIVAYETETPPRAHSLPMVASYITSRVRRELADALRACPDALYCDTDSIHLPASSDPPPHVGTEPGRWAAKVRGWAFYQGRRSYEIGHKTVGAPRGF